MRDVICAGDPELFTYLMGWLAHLVQKPAELPEVAFALRGLKGTGKSVFAKTVGALVPVENFAHLTHAKHLVGHFNAHLEAKLVVFADEAFWSGDKQGAEALKGLITESTVMIERKGVDAFSVANYGRFIFATNNDWAVPASADERRFCVFDVSDKRQRDDACFRAVMQQMKVGGLAAMLHDLQALDLTGFNIRKPPMSAGLHEQKLWSLKPIEKWWHAVLVEGQPLFHKCPWTYPQPCGKLYAVYHQYHATTLLQTHPLSESAFGRKLHELVPGIVRKKMTRDDNGERDWHYLLPPLEECRAAWDVKMGWPEVWEEPEPERSGVVVAWPGGVRERGGVGGNERPAADGD